MRAARRNQDATLAHAQRLSIAKVPMVIVFIHGTEVARQAGDLVGTTVDRALNDSPDNATD